MHPSDFGRKKNRPFKRPVWFDLRLEALHQAFGSFVMVILQTIFVSDDLTIKFVHQFINCSVQISVRALGKHVGSFDMNIAFRSLPSLFFLLFLHREKHFDIHDLVKMPNDPI
jgi:hypothetical protein